MTITLNGTTGITTPAVDLTTPLPAADGGTGLSSVGTAGNVLTSNGTSWVSSAPSGGVTSLNGETGAITNTSLYAIGSYVTGRPVNKTNYAVNSTVAGSSLYSAPPGSESASGDEFYCWSYIYGQGVLVTGSLVNTGTWRCVSQAYSSGSNTPAFSGLWVRIS